MEGGSGGFHGVKWVEYRGSLLVFNVDELDGASSTEHVLLLFGGKQTPREPPNSGSNNPCIFAPVMLFPVNDIFPMLAVACAEPN